MPESYVTPSLHPLSSIGMVVGGLAVVADMLGSASSGAGVVMAVTIIFQYYEIVIREGGGMFANYLGVE
jgi:preprotein translocase subunit SecY